MVQQSRKPETLHTAGGLQDQVHIAEKVRYMRRVCPQDDALQFYRGKLVSIDRSRCTHCMECADMCPSEAIRQWGRLMSTEECMNEIRKDMDFYKRSGGGVTVSGGEPLLQSDFVAELFRACKDEQIHTCCESTFHVDWSESKKSDHTLTFSYRISSTWTTISTGPERVPETKSCPGKPEKTGVGRYRTDTEDTCVSPGFN